MLMKTLMISLTGSSIQILLSKSAAHVVKQLGLEKFIEHQRNGTFAVLKGRYVFVVRHIGSSESLIYQMISRAQDYMNQLPLKGISIEKEFAPVLKPLFSLFEDKYTSAERDKRRRYFLVC